MREKPIAMEKRKCKLCLKSFANGRALGGHMRSHMMNLYNPPKTEQRQEQVPNYKDQIGRGTDLASSSSSSGEEDDEEDEEREYLSYGLRENPKKSVRLVDPEFSFAGSVVLVQDRESETESSKNLIRRRSKRIRKSGISDYDQAQSHCQKNPKRPDDTMKKSKSGISESEPVSSISDTSPEEDVAYCLMMLSRDEWMREKEEPVWEPEESNDHSENDDPDDYVKTSKSTRQGRGKYTCETCFKVFKSYQALGGHRASHKKARTISAHEPLAPEPKKTGEVKVHECPYCYRVFSSGQALGGHKRSHVIGSSSAATIVAAKTKIGHNLIDLNLPAPIDDDYDEISQIELSAVSDAEFFNPIK